MPSQRVLSYKDRNGALLAWTFLESAVIFLGGCGMNSESVPLTAEDAREALVAMVDARGVDVEYWRPDLDGEIVRIDENEVMIGWWHCYLRKRRFAGHRGSDWFQLELSGSFRLNEKKQWEAVITGESLAEFPLPEPSLGLGGQSAGGPGS